MALRIYKCPLCKKVKRTLKKSVPKCNRDKKGNSHPVKTMKEEIPVPGSKFLECANAATGKSKLRNKNKILLERSRNHSRDHSLDDTIQINRDNELGVSNNLLNEHGQRRKKVDDL